MKLSPTFLCYMPKQSSKLSATRPSTFTPIFYSMTTPECHFGQKHAAMQSGSGFQETEIGFRRAEIGFRTSVIGFLKEENNGPKAEMNDPMTEGNIGKAKMHCRRASGIPRWPSGFVQTMEMHHRA